MQTLFDFFIMILFFVFFKLFNIYAATGVAMAAALIQVIVHRIRFKRFDRFQLIFLGIIMVLGSLTLFFQNPWFIKWKPTVIYWLIATVLLTSTRFGNKSLLEKSMESVIQVPKTIWTRLNYTWVGFLLVMGFANLYVAYYYDLNTWVNFKLFGTTSCLFVFLLAQFYVLNRYQLPNTKTSNSS